MRAASEWIWASDRKQRRKAMYPFDHRERKGWRIIPTRLDGVQLRHMTPTQRGNVRQLLQAGLSDIGFDKVNDILWLEPFVRERSSKGIARLTKSLRDPGRYFFTLYGTPKRDAPWRIRFDGHHLSMSWTAVPGEPLSVTPALLGAEPRVHPKGSKRAGHRVLGEEEDRGRALYLALTPEQRKRVALPLKLANGAFLQRRPLFVGDDRKRPRPQGLPRGEMTDHQQALLDAIVDTYLANYPPEVQDAHRNSIDAAGRDAIVFAWSGSSKRGKPSYYRLVGPTFLIEFDNTAPKADHVHTIYRRWDGDFGEDLLSAHYRDHHTR